MLDDAASEKIVEKIWEAESSFEHLCEWPTFPIELVNMEASCRFINHTLDQAEQIRFCLCTKEFHFPGTPKKRFEARK